MKDRKSGGVNDPMPMGLTIPHSEIIPNSHELMMMKGSINFRKRTRKPKVDAENPLCGQRQLTDAYELIRRNRNPALYRPTKADTMRSVKMLNQHSRAIEDADVTSVKLRVLESVGANASALQLRRDLHDGVVASARPVDPRLAAESIPNFDTYTRGSSVTSAEGTTYGYGHKPRIFNPLTNDLTRESNTKAEVSEGLSVAQLRDLLSGGGSRKTTCSLPSGFIGDSQQKKLRQKSNPRDSRDSLDLASQFNYATLLDHQEEAQPAWDHTFAAPSLVQGLQNPLPHPGVSELQRDSSMHQPFREKLAASRAVAAGTRISAVASERQFMDKQDLKLAGNGLKRSQGGLNGELSPRRSYQRDEVRKLKDDWRKREASAAARVKQREHEEVLARIPQPNPPSLPSRHQNEWNSSFLLGEDYSHHAN